MSKQSSTKFQAEVIAEVETAAFAKGYRACATQALARVLQVREGRGNLQSLGDWLAGVTVKTNTELTSEKSPATDLALLEDLVRRVSP